MTDPRHQRALDNVAFFGKEIKKIKTTGLRGETGRVLPKPKPSPTETFKRTIERDLFQRTKAFQNYEKLCRGEIRNLVSIPRSIHGLWVGKLELLIKCCLILGSRRIIFFI